MAPPAIIAFRLVSPPPEAGYEGTLAILTIGHGPWIVGGLRLCIDAQGGLFFRPPRMKIAQDRVILRSGPERDALLREAKNMMSGFLETRLAASPLATAPQLEPSS